MMTYFVGGVGVPDDEFAILRGRNQVSRVRTPMHSIHLQAEAKLFSMSQNNEDEGKTLDKCPRRVLRVLICIRPIGSMLPVACRTT